MPQNARARTRTCPDCDGFPTVAVTTGTRRRDGSRVTARAVCATCTGLGRIPTAPSVVPAGR